MEPTEVIRLHTKLRIVYYPVPWSYTISVGIWVDAGTKDEEKGEEGIAHFLEHMLFKGTKRKSGRQIAQLIDALGGNIDAFTEKELTCFYMRVLPEHLIQGLSLLKEILTEPLLRPKDIEVEKGVILAEIQNIEDTPEEMVGEAFFEALWDGHPLSRPILGTKESVRKFRRSHLIRFLKRHYIPEKIVISGAGSMEPSRFFDLISQHFGNWRNNSIATTELEKPPNPSPSLRFIQRQTEHFYFTFGVQGFKIADRAHYPASVLDMIVGGGASSRLFMEVREKRGLAYSIGSLSASFKQAGFFAIGGNCEPSKAEKVVQVIAKELKRICQNGVGKEELERAKTQLKLSVVMAQESVTGLMMRLGRQIHYFGEPVPVEQIIRSIDQVTADDVVEIAQKLFSENKFAAALLGPIKESEAERLLAILNDLLGS
ncbi:MAG: insulinase family protein [Armatimonadetes bacterium]|nr:insulinase family protein [Armatimonadota bacterium]MDW8029244.1 pitrilysin family protein [Armatimonadota bacterium]